MIVGVNFVVGAGFGLLLMRLRNRSLRLRLPSQKITATKSTQISVVFMILLLSNCSSCRMLLTAWTHYDVDRKWDRSLFICFEAGGVQLPEIRHVNVRLSQQALPDKLMNAVKLRAHDYSARILVKIDFVINGKLIWQTTVTLGTGEPS